MVTIAERRFLIVINRTVFKRLPGINIIPLDASRAFLALGPARGMSDLELAVIDRLENPSTAPRARQALGRLRTQLRIWRRDRALRVHTRAIIVVERVAERRPRQRVPESADVAVQFRRAGFGSTPSGRVENAISNRADARRLAVK